MGLLHGFKKAALLVAGVCSLFGSVVFAAPQERAQEELAREQGRIHAEAARESATVKSPKEFFASVKRVIVVGNDKMTEDEVLSLLPELKRETVNIRNLSRQIQMVNDTGGMKLGADFRPDGEGYLVTVSVEEKKSEHVYLSVDNTGNRYIGEWRSTLSYLATNATHHADTFGAAVVTSPGHWDDVKQAALSYRMLFPKDAGSLVFTASWSDVELGSVAVETGLFDYTAAGRGIAFGLHGQKYFSYTSRNKDILDIGIDHKYYDNQTQLTWGGVPIPGIGYDYAVTMLSAAYIHNDRSTHHAFTYNLGVSTNLGGDTADYEKATLGSDKHFFLWKGGASYQYKTPGDWLFGLRLHGQYTKDNVVSCEQLGAGGLYTVRGFNERAVSADTGLVGSFEIFTPEFIPHSRFCLFADYGTLHNNNSQALFGSETLASAGIGYRYTDEKNGISFRLEYAKILDDLRQDLIGKQGHKNWNAVLTISF